MALYSAAQEGHRTDRKDSWQVGKNEEDEKGSIMMRTKNKWEGHGTDRMDSGQMRKTQCSWEWLTTDEKLINMCVRACVRACV